MRKFRFKTERLNLRPGSSVLLTDFEAQHAHRVLRLKKGDVIYLFNGEKEYKAMLKLVTNETVMAKVLSETVNSINTVRKHAFTLFIGMPKIKNFELILEKTAELGIGRIVPVITEYSIIKMENLAKKRERWEKIILTACKQSERIDIPTLSDPVDFHQALEIAKNDTDVSYLFTIPRTKAIELIKIEDLKPKEDIEQVGLFIGPEGGFSPFELKDALTIENIELVNLFSEVLRTETAAISALSILRYLYR